MNERKKERKKDRKKERKKEGRKQGRKEIKKERTSDCYLRQGAGGRKTARLGSRTCFFR